MKGIVEALVGCNAAALLVVSTGTLHCLAYILINVHELKSFK